ncbi:MAG: DUF3604 domain-containing protein [Halioglobus sp.]
MALRRVRLFLLFGLTIIALMAVFWMYQAVSGRLGQQQGSGEIAQQPRVTSRQQDEQQRQNLARAESSLPDAQRLAEKHILFGDLHVHSTYSFDAYNVSLPMYLGEGSHPPGDACDFARYCSGLDFWSINDHAEALTARQWSLTKAMVRQCNAVAGDPANPDMVTFLGWEWTQTATRAENHYGHKNVLLRDTAEDLVPVRPIAAVELPHPGGLSFHVAKTRLLLVAGVPDGNLRLLFQRILNWLRGEAGASATFPNADARQRYYNFNRYLQDQSEIEPCPRDQPVRDLPPDCQESAATPAQLFARLDEWGFPYLAIPHGTTWGFYTPPLSSWDKQLAADAHPDRREPLIEIFSGHGNAEQYRSWRAVQRDADGNYYCPEPTADFLPRCWQAGELIRERCRSAGESEMVCESRAADTRAKFILTQSFGHWIVPDTRVEDWLDAGQCRDCYMPAYNHRPAGSVQYGLAIRNFSDPTHPPKRFRWGILGSSDSHTARPGTGYKEIHRRNMTDAALEQLGPREFKSESERLPFDFELAKADGRGGPFYERQSSFFGTGGLVAVHARGRDRQSIWDALQRKEVYATSGDRILLWFDLLDTQGTGRQPMGSSVQRETAPQFEVSAIGAFEQKPGCPADSVRALPADRLQRLCGGECYNPGDTRKRIERIEVVRIRPQIVADEAVEQLIEDPWMVLPCPPDSESCTVRFSDTEFATAGRDAVYYVRALEAASPTINAGNLRCARDETGQCIAVNPCRAVAPTAYTDDCLTDAQERAWSSPIFVDYGRSLQP